MHPMEKQPVSDKEKFDLLLGESLSDAGDHPWVHDAEEVSLGSSGQVFIVRFDTSQLPAFIFENDRFEVLEVWVDTVPGSFRKMLVGAENCRRFGWGRLGLSALIRVLPGDVRGSGGGDA